jgi:DNA-binding NtrC family response regulator
MPRILLVNDDENVLRSLQHDLSRLRGDLEAFAQPRQALARADFVSFDLVVTGYRMTGMDGLNLVKALKKRQPDLVAIMLSGLVDLNASMSARSEVEIFRYVTRPWDADDLRAVVCQALAQSTPHRPEQREPVTAKPKGALAALETKYPGITQPGSDWTPPESNTP